MVKIRYLFFQVIGADQRGMVPSLFQKAELAVQAFIMRTVYFYQCCFFHKSGGKNNNVRRIMTNSLYFGPA